MILANCLICTETFQPKDHISCLSCGHLYHNKCISKWLTKKSSCPQCRTVDVGRYIQRIYFNEVNLLDSSLIDNSELSDFELKRIKIQIQEQKQLYRDCSLAKNELEIENKHFKFEINNLRKENESLKLENSLYQQNVDYAALIKDREIEQLKSKIKKYRYLEKIIEKNDPNIQFETDKYFNGNSPDDKIKTLTSTICVLKNDMKQLKEDLLQEQCKSNKAIVANLELEEKCKQLTENMTKITEPDNDPYQTPIRNRSLKRNLSTPQALLMSSPDTPGSEVRLKQLKEAKSANVFQVNKIHKSKSSQQQGSSNFNLDKLPLMRNFQFEKPKKTNCNIGPTKLIKKGFF